MKLVVSCFILALLSLGLLAPAIAQDSTSHCLGLGVSIEPALFGAQYIIPYTEGIGYTVQPAYSSTPFNLYIPWRIARNLRLEPSIGYYAYTLELGSWTPPYQGQSSSSSSDKYEYSLTTLGLKLDYLIPAAEQLQFYVGPKIAYRFSRIRSTSAYSSATYQSSSESSTKQTDYLLGVDAGAEYFPIRDLSLGGQVDLNYVSFGNPEETASQNPPYQGPATTTTREGHIVATGALIFLRWYFL